MKAECILHYAFRARDPQAMGKFYAELFDGKFFLHPVMTGLGIVIVKISAGGCFVGLLEFWPWDVEWFGEAGEFRRVKAQPPAGISYGHLALKIPQDPSQVTAELDRKGVKWHMEPRAPGFSIPCITDPEGNMIELFCNIDDMPLPPEALCPPEHAAGAIKAIREQFAEKTKNHPAGRGYPLLTT